MAVTRCVVHNPSLGGHLGYKYKCIHKCMDPASYSGSLEETCILRGERDMYRLREAGASLHASGKTANNLTELGD